MCEIAWRISYRCCFLTLLMNRRTEFFLTRVPLSNYLHSPSKPWGFRSRSRELRYLTVLSNDETFGIHIAEAVKYRIIDEVLNLERIDWSARYSIELFAMFSYL
jgi:hypothetical protein